MQVRRPKTNDQRPTTNDQRPTTNDQDPNHPPPPCFPRRLWTADRRPLKFQAYENNPILGPGEPGEWDALSSNTPDVVYHDGVYYLFYTGSKIVGNMSVGLAISSDGYHFTKYTDNPVFRPSKNGFDAYAVGATRILKVDSLWWMFYNAMEFAGFSPGPYIGRAMAYHPTGTWIRHNAPVLTSGRQGEWDDGFIIPCSVLVLDDGSYMMYYTGGKEYHTFKDFYLGIATSRDGISWEKYNDPATIEPPFKDSDPVIFPGKGNEWDNSMIWISDIKKNSEGYKMYYTGIKENEMVFNTSIGFAFSEDGIHWNKYPGNPVFTAKDDPISLSLNDQTCIENPLMLNVGKHCFMYYDYGGPVESIGVATMVLNN
jgi:predicted GH43/DUF377 family glycosyl hydrolase